MVIKTASNFIVCCHGKGSKLCTMCYADALASQKSDLIAKVLDDKFIELLAQESASYDRNNESWYGHDTDIGDLPSRLKELLKKRIEELAK